MALTVRRVACGEGRVGRDPHLAKALDGLRLDVEAEDGAVTWWELDA